MKKKNILWSILGLLLVLVSCSQDLDEAMPTSSNQQQRSVATNHFYGTVAANQTTTRGIAQLDKVWRAGTTIKVKLLNDPYNMADKIKEAAMEWEEYANIKFRFVETNEDAHVRIGFDWNENRWITWSYTGTDCKIVTKQNEPTMSFAFFDILTEEERQGDILRALGQVLGLELEHRHLDFDAGWTKYISQYWVGEIEDIPWDELKKYVFDPLDAENVMQTDQYDENSIMIWPFNRKYANNTARDFNNKLSDKDKEFIDKLYPGKEKAIITLKIEESFLLSFRIQNTSEITIDWGDGDKITYQASDYWGDVLQKGSSSKGAREIKFYGDPTTITKFGFEKGSEAIISYLDISKCTNLEVLLSFYCEIKNLDLSKCTKLKELDFKGENLNISNCLDLESLDLRGDNFKNLDLSKHIRLKSLNIYITPKLAEINLSNCLNLESLSIREAGLTTLDVSKLTKLTSLSCQNNNINNLDISKLINLERLYCNDNNLNDLDITNNLKLENLYCGGNNLENLDVTHNIKLAALYCGRNNLSNLNIANNINLSSLNCEGNNLSNLNVANNINLTNLDCGRNKLNTLDLTNNLKLSEVSCSRNNLNSLSVSHLKKLWSLDITNNPLYFNESEMISIAYQLETRDKHQAITIIGNFAVLSENRQEVSGWIESILESKSWRFYNTN